jgi:predicted RNA binding protein YcfA (HicA-like mRNA interferase family)
LSKLPTQLKWNLFVKALEELDYQQLKSKGGSARHFQRGDEDPVTFHEPHGSSTIPQGTLTEYLRKLKIDRDKFEAALEGFASEKPVDDERFLRKVLPNGNHISNCMECYGVVAEVTFEEDLAAAEAAHVCRA